MFEAIQQPLQSREDHVWPQVVKNPTGASPSTIRTDMVPRSESHNDDANNVNPGLINPGLLIRGVLLQ